MVIIKQTNSYLKNLRNVSHDIYDFISLNRGAPIYVSVLTKRPKLIISKGFFYYMNGQIVTDKTLYIYYKKLLERLKDLKLTVICEYDKLDIVNPKNLNLLIVDAINESFSLSHKNIHLMLLNIQTHFTYVKLGCHFIIGDRFPEQGLPGILKYYIEKEKAASFLVRTDEAKDDFRTKKMDSYLYTPVTIYKNGILKTTFMLNEKPII